MIFTLESVAKRGSSMPGPSVYFLKPCFYDGSAEIPDEDGNLMHACNALTGACKLRV